jgi:hypothetical protein
LSVKSFLTSSVTVNQHSVLHNGNVVFNQPGLDGAGFLLAWYHSLGISYPKFYKMDNLSKLGWLAADVLLQNSQVSDRYSAHKIGVVLANANSSLDADIKYSETLNTIPSPAQFVYTLPNIVIGEISIRNKFKGENAFFIQKEFDPEFIVNYVNHLLDHRILDACICGWVDMLGEDYKAMLFLVETAPAAMGEVFTPDSIIKLIGETA